MQMLGILLAPQAMPPESLHSHMPALLGVMSPAITSYVSRQNDAANVEWNFEAD